MGDTVSPWEFIRRQADNHLATAREYIAASAKEANLRYGEQSGIPWEAHAVRHLKAALALLE